MNLAYNIDAVNSSPKKAIDTNNLIAVSISEQHYEINNNKNNKRKKTKNILLKLQRKQTISLTKQELINKIKEKYNSFSVSEKEKFWGVLDNANKQNHEILNIMMIITKAFGKTMQIEGVDEEQQANDIKYWQSYLDSAQNSLKNQFDTENGLEAKSASHGNAAFWGILVGVVIAAAVIVLIPEMLPEAAAEEPEAAGLMATNSGANPMEATGAANASEESQAGLVAQDAPPPRAPTPRLMQQAHDLNVREAANPAAGVGDGVANPVSDVVDGSQAQPQVDEPQGPPKRSYGKRFMDRLLGRNVNEDGSKAPSAGERCSLRKSLKNIPLKKILTKAPGKLATIGGAGMMTYMILNAAAPQWAPHPKGQIDQAELEKESTNNTIITNITNDMNNRIQTSSKRASDDSQTVSQASGYVQQAINALGMAMSIRV